jgi:eukaryotic-like serine/threonine-protein kinase
LLSLSAIGANIPQFREYLSIENLTGELLLLFANLVLYKDSAHNFVVKYPQNWIYQKEDDPITHEIVSFMPPSKIEPMQNPQVEVIIRKEDFPEEITLSDYMEQLINQHKNARNFQSFKIIKQGDITFDQRPGKSLIYTAIHGGKSWKILEVATIKDTQVYLITYKAETSQYDKYTAIVLEMVRSFEINN